MNEQHTIKLLRECDAGIKMGIVAIDDVIRHVDNKEFHDKLFGYKQEYNRLQNEIQGLLEKHKDEGKSPNPVVRGMAWMKTSLKICLDESDKNIADIMTDGCNMGIKTLNKFLNLFADADDESVSLAKRLVNLGERQVTEMRQFL